MRPVLIDTTEDRFIVSIDKDLLLQFVENLRTEFLAREVDFSEDFEQLGEEIQDQWWSENKDRFVPNEDQ